MASGWRLLCQTVCGLEGIVGLSLNIFLFLIVANKRITASILSYRFCIGVSATQNAVNCILLIAGLWTHVFSEDFFLAIVYGPIKYAQPWIVDLIVSLAVAMVFSLWQFISAPCIVQYLVLRRKSMSDFKRISTAYVLPAISMVISAPYFWLFTPYPEIRDHIRGIAADVQHLRAEDDIYEVYGIGMRADPANGNRTLYALAFYGIAPSYLLNTLAFGFTVYKIVLELRSVGSTMSVKTVEMQNCFIRMQMIQGFVPLAILAIPFFTFISFIATGANLNNLTLILTFSSWSLPTMQALVYLKFLSRSIHADNHRKMAATAAISNFSATKHRAAVNRIADDPRSSVISDHGDSTLHPTHAVSQVI